MRTGAANESRHMYKGPGPFCFIRVMSSEWNTLSSGRATFHWSYGACIQDEHIMT